MSDEDISSRVGSGNKRVLLTLSSSEHALLADVAEYCGVPVATLIRKFLAEFGVQLAATVSEMREMEERGLASRQYLNSIIGVCFSLVMNEELFEDLVAKETAIAHFILDLKKD